MNYEKYEKYSDWGIAIFYTCIMALELYLQKYLVVIWVANCMMFMAMAMSWKKRLNQANERHSQFLNQMNQRLSQATKHSSITTKPK